MSLPRNRSSGPRSCSSDSRAPRALEATNDPEAAIDILGELADIAKQVEAELEQAREREAGECALDEHRELFEEYLAELPFAEELGALTDAMRYSLDGGGKRIRPLLCLASGEAMGARPEELLPAAAAIELVHTFGMVHDDLPALDDDDVRRGRRRRTCSSTRRRRS